MPHRQLALPVYLVAFALAILPPLDALIQVMPFRLGEARWRFGAFGLVNSSLLWSLTGLVIALIAATVFEHRRLRKVIGVVAALGALVISSAWIVFVLDVLQVHRDIRPAAALAFKIASVTAATKALFAVVTLAAVAKASLRRSRAKPIPKSSRANELILAANDAGVDVASRSN